MALLRRTQNDVHEPPAQRGASDPVEAREAAQPAPVLSVIVPTRNEAANVGELVRRIRATQLNVPIEIIFVDDSDDDTPAVINAVANEPSSNVILLHRSESERVGGLGGAVVAGLNLARAPWVCVIDGDLQHPPELLVDVMRKVDQGNCDIVVASRYCANGDGHRLGALRLLMSRATTHLAKFAFPSRLKGVTDPMSGFFAVRRAAVTTEALRPRGFKILLEILVRNPALRATEVPFEFGERYAGDSKASMREALRFCVLLLGLRFGDGSRRVGRFVTVGLSGLIVNTAALALFTEYGGLHYLWSAVLATQASTAWNFALTELWVFKNREHGRHAALRLGSFWAMNNLALWVRGPALYLLTSSLGLHYLLSNFITLGALTVARYAFADTWIWKSAEARTRAARLHLYNIHGIISVASDARLPELEKFRTSELLDPPTIRVRIGKVNADPDSTPPDGTRRTCYDEGLGPFGFGMSIDVGAQTEVVASSLLKFSPHVLYTNVVEPILRWRFVELGYALVHGACVSIDGQAFLITARTDTGKTTTMLKLLDAHPWSFLSDDLTLITPEGAVLMYPKPMTISRHTVHAVKAPRLTWLERLTLIPQSRLHSRSGRIFAMFIARTHLPVATVNTIVQMLVPPPKYHVSRLIPGVDVAPVATLAGLMIIQRGGTGEERLAESEAISILMENCEDAYGFPPYHTIEDFLHSSNGGDLRAMERRFVTEAFAGKPATVLRSETMDWAERLPALVDHVMGVRSLNAMADIEAMPARSGTNKEEHLAVPSALALPLEPAE